MERAKQLLNVTLFTHAEPRVLPLADLKSELMERN